MSLANTSNKLIFKNTAFLYLRMAVVLLISLVITRVVLRSLGEIDYGIYNAICGFVALFSFINSTLSVGFNRFYNVSIGANDAEGLQRVFSNSVLMQVFLSVIIVLVIELFGLWYINNVFVLPLERIGAARIVFHVSVVSLAFTLLQAPYMSLVLAYEKMNFYSLVSIIDAILKLFIAYALIKCKGDRLVFYGLLMGGISILNFISYYLYVKLSYHIKIDFKADRKLLKSMITFSGWTLLNPIAFTARSQGSNIVLNYFFGPVMNAAYSITNQVASALDSFSGSISTAFRPQIIQSYSSQNYQRTNYLIFSMSKCMFALVLLLFSPLFFNLPFVFHIWLGGSIPDFTIEFTYLIMVVKLIDSLNAPIFNGIMASGNIKKYMVYSFMAICSFLPVSIVVFMGNASPIYLFVSMVISTVLNQVVCVAVLSHRVDGFIISNYISQVVLPILFHFIVVFLSVFCFDRFVLVDSSIVKLIVDCFLSVTVSIVSFYLVALSRNERIIVNENLKGFLKRYKSVK